VIQHLAPLFERYITLHRVHPTKTYNYAKREYFGYTVIEATRHLPKCAKAESWMYVAAPSGARLATIMDAERLYVGAQTQDRMFRGDGGIGGSNFHHAEMRSGNGTDTLERLLRSGTEVSIYRIDDKRLTRAVNTFSVLAPFRVLLDQPITARTHRGWWFEQAVLHTEAGRWRWNTQPADRRVATLFQA
jgi:hypothetical protein